MLVKVQGRDALYRPLAGTRPRGRNEKEDRDLEAKLLADPKERAEHVMLVDLGPQRSGARLRIRLGESRAADVRRALFARDAPCFEPARPPARRRRLLRCADGLLSCGHLSGAPKVRAMEIIDELEPTRRGIYGGAILYLDFSGNLDSCIGLRTLVAKNGRAYVQAGAGIVADSVPAREYQESVNKARARDQGARNRA